MTPGAWRAGGQGMTIEFASGDSSLGAVLVAATERGLCAVSLGNDPAELERDLRTRFHAAEIGAANAAFDHIVQQVIDWLDASLRT